MFPMNHYTQSFLENILNSIPDPVFVKDEQHIWIMMNDAFAKFLGHPMEKLIGKSDFDFFPEEEARVFWEKDEQVFQTEKENINEESFTDSNKVVHIISTRKQIVKDENGKKFLVGIIHDITEKKQALEKYQQSNAMLANYAHMVSHELKSPIRTIISFSNLLKESAQDGLDESSQEYLHFIVQAATTMNTLTHNLLQFSKINSQKLEIKKIDIHQLIQDVSEELKLTYPNQVYNIDLNLSTLPSTLYADPVLLKQLFQNLLYNAIKFKSDKRSLQIDILGKAMSDVYLFTIRDNGIGISEQYLTQIFGMFKRLHNNSDYEGSGIGLAICNLIVNHHKGEIWVESEIDKGSQFKFTISNSLA